jgi:uncharacterized protein YdiU (UPF0061 family)
MRFNKWQRILTQHLRFVENGEGDTGGSESGSDNSEPKSFTQEEVDAIVEKRLARTKSQFGDYEALKAKAAKFDEAENANKSELQKAQEREAELQKQVDAYTSAKQQDEWKAEVSKKTNVPANLLRGSSLEEIQAHAEALSEVLNPKPKGAPLHHQGDQPSGAAKNAEGREFVHRLFGN